MRAAAVAGGWLFAAAIVWLSLTPTPPRVDIEHADKLEHFLAYGLLMLWFGRLYRAHRVRVAYALLWAGMGVAVEFMQRATGYRSFDPADMIASALGVLAGAVLAFSFPGAGAARE